MKTPLLLLLPLLLLQFAESLAAQVAGTLESTFNPGGGTSYVTLIQPDGKILMGGAFNTVGGQPRNCIARLLEDGSVESLAGFNTGTGVDQEGFGLRCMALQDDGSIIIGGNIIRVNGENRNGIARLRPDGAHETLATFNPGSGAWPYLNSLTIQPDGKILLAGPFTTFNGQTRNRIARLNTGGTLESTATFNTGTGANQQIYAMALQQDGSILIAGAFTMFNGQPRFVMARLLPSGNLESTATFNPGTGPNDVILTIVVQPDGKILVGGSFTTFNGQPRNRIARLNADGSLENIATFNPGTGVTGGSSPSVEAIGLQTDGKILIGGIFTMVNGQARGNVARLHSNGALESSATFDVGTGTTGSFSSEVHSFALQSDGKIVLGGSYGRYNGVLRAGIARLANDPASDSLTVTSASRVQWLRSGASGEAQRVTFALLGPGGWTELGAGTRIAGGWEVTGLNLPDLGIVRARARTSCGIFNGSSGLLERAAVFILPLPGWRRDHFGTPENAGEAADNADPDKDGIENLVEFAFGRNPLLPDANLLPAWGPVEGGFLLEFTEPAANRGISWHVEKSNDLSAGNWMEIPNTAVSPAHSHLVPVGTSTRLFLRIRISSP